MTFMFLPLAGVHVMTKMRDAAKLGEILPIELAEKFVACVNDPAAVAALNTSDTGLTLDENWSLLKEDDNIWLDYMPLDGMSPDQIDTFLQEHGLGANPYLSALIEPRPDADGSMYHQLWHNLTNDLPWRTGFNLAAPAHVN